MHVVGSNGKENTDHSSKSTLIAIPLNNENPSCKPTPVRTRRPFPARQLALLGFLLLNESICSMMLVPFVGLFVAHLDDVHPDAAGYASGFLIGVYQFALVISGKRWGNFSDRYGRKVALQLGIMLSSAVMVAFGMSQSVFMAIVFRFLHGLANGASVVAKSAIGEMVDPEDEAKGFSVISLAWGLGSLMGPAIGGLLYDPTRHDFLGLSKDGVFRTNPALLPSLVIAFYSTVSLFVSIACLEETNKNAISFFSKATKRSKGGKVYTRLALEPPSSTSTSTGLSSTQRQSATNQMDSAGGGPSEANPPDASGEGMSRRDIGRRGGHSAMLAATPPTPGHPTTTESHTFGVADEGANEMTSATAGPSHPQGVNGTSSVSVAGAGGAVNSSDEDDSGSEVTFTDIFANPLTRNTVLIYMIIAWAEISFFETLPLWGVASQERGGLGRLSEVVGLIVILVSVPCLISNATFAPVSEYVGMPGPLWRLCTYMWLASVAALPFSNLLNHAPMVQLVVIILIVSVWQVASAWCFSIVFVLVARTAPPGNLGAMNGAAQSLASAVRAVAPILVAPAFAWSVGAANRTYPLNHHCAFIIGVVPMIATLPLVSQLESSRRVMETST